MAQLLAISTIGQSVFFCISYWLYYYIFCFLRFLHSNKNKASIYKLIMLLSFFSKILTEKKSRSKCFL